jgi:hypothetical protein
VKTQPGPSVVQLIVENQRFLTELINSSKTELIELVNSSKSETTDCGSINPPKGKWVSQARRLQNRVFSDFL